MLKKLTPQGLTDMVEGAAILNGGGGGDPLVGFNIVEKLLEGHRPVSLIDSSEIPDDEAVVDFACVGATASIAYHSDAAVKTLKILEESLERKVFAVVPSELGAVSTLAAVDTAARHGIPVVDADGAGRGVPELHLQTCMVGNTKSAPAAIADINAENVTVKQTNDCESVERLARKLAADRNQMVYVARQVQTTKNVRTSLVLRTLSTSIRIGMLLRKAVDPLRAVLRETNGSLLFEGVVSSVERETKQGFTWTSLKIDGVQGSSGSKMELKAKNEFLIAYNDGKPVATAPDIISTVNSETYKCVPAEKVTESNKLSVLGIPAPGKWRSLTGLRMWREVMQRAGISERYVPIEKLTR